MYDGKVKTFKHSKDAYAFVMKSYPQAQFNRGNYYDKKITKSRYNYSGRYMVGY